MGLADRQGSAYLKSALLAVIVTSKVMQRPFQRVAARSSRSFRRRTQWPVELPQGAYSYQSRWKGALHWLRERLNEAPSEKVRAAIEELVSPGTCPECKGRRLRADSLAVRLGGRGIADYTTLPIEDATAVFAKIKLNPREEKIAGPILRK